MSTPLAERAAQVAADPVDGNALRQLARALDEASDLEGAVLAHVCAARAFSAAGQLPMAIVSAREVALLDGEKAAALTGELAAAYGRESKRVDPSFRRRPPRPPEATPAAMLPPDAAASAQAALRLAEQKIANLQDGPIPAFPLFHALGGEPFRRLVAVCQVREMEAGATVIEVGSPGDAMFIVARGTIRISRQGGNETEGEVILSHLRAGAFFGEMSLLTESPRAARATCESAATLLEIARKNLDELATAEPEFAQVLAAYTRERLLQNLMLTSGLFAELDEEARARLLGRFGTRIFEAGATLFEEGQPGGNLYVVLSGQLSVEKRDQDQQPIRISQLGPGDVVGEISLLTRRAATATVRAAGKTVVLALDRNDFNAIVGEFPAILSHLYQLAVSRERDLERLLTEALVEAEDYLI